MLKNQLKFGFQKRHVIILMVFLGNTIITFLHTNLSMALVQMTTLKNTTIPGGTYEMRAEFNWTSVQKGLILSSYSYGRLFCPIGGLLAGKLGGSTVYSIGNLGVAVITFFSPSLLYTSITFFIIVYVIFGIFEAFLIAGVPQLISRWAPPDERSKFVAFGDMGFYVGAVVSFVVSGCVLKTYRWQLLFYGSGMASFGWFWIWLLIVKNDPEDDKHLTEVERKYIQSELNHLHEEEKLVYPWRRIFTFMTLWVAALAEFSIVGGYIFTSALLPQYIKDTEDLNIAEIGFTSTIPQICGIIFLPVVGCLGDYIRSRKIFSITNVHRLFASISLFLAAIFYAIIAIWSNFIIDIIVLSSFQVCSIFILVDITVLFLDIAPKYTAFLISIVNMIAISSGIIVPSAVGLIVQSHSLAEWNQFFIILSSMYVCVALLYLKFVSGKPISWADNNPNEGQIEHT